MRITHQQRATLYPQLREPRIRYFNEKRRGRDIVLPHHHGQFARFKTTELLPQHLFCHLQIVQWHQVQATCRIAVGQRLRKGVFGVYRHRRIPGCVDTFKDRHPDFLASVTQLIQAGSPFIAQPPGNAAESAVFRLSKALEKGPQTQHCLDVPRRPARWQCDAVPLSAHGEVSKDAGQLAPGYRNTQLQTTLESLNCCTLYYIDSPYCARGFVAEFQPSQTPPNSPEAPLQPAIQRTENRDSNLLILTRRPGEALKIGDCTVTVLNVQGDKIKIGILAPDNVTILRSELLEIDAEREKKSPKR